MFTSGELTKVHCYINHDDFVNISFFRSVSYPSSFVKWMIECGIVLVSHTLIPGKPFYSKNMNLSKAKSFTSQKEEKNTLSDPPSRYHRSSDESKQ